MKKKTLNLYKETKDIPNPSQGLLRLLKRKPYYRVWAMCPSFDQKGFVTLRQLKAKKLRNVTLRLGTPASFGSDLKFRDGGMSVKSRAFSGFNLREYMFIGSKRGHYCLVGIGHEKTKTWMIDVTERVIAELNEIGACALSTAHCKFEQISPRVKQCKFCGDKLKAKIVTRKTVEWIREI